MTEIHSDQGPGQEQFEQFLLDHDLTFEPVPVSSSRRPDYLVNLGMAFLFFEIKALTSDDNFAGGEGMRVSSRTVGDHIRSKIDESKKQIQYGANRGAASILLIYNALDPMHRFGTEPHDFRAAMHGEWTVALSQATGKVLAAGYGKNRKLGVGWNSSFSGLGHLSPGPDGKMTVRLYPNKHAKVPLPPLPPCFEIDHAS